MTDIADKCPGCLGCPVCVFVMLRKIGARQISAAPSQWLVVVPLEVGSEREQEILVERSTRSLTSEA
jgi:hypothetical protein